MDLVATWDYEHLKWASVTGELIFTFNLILNNFHLNINSYEWLVATVLNSIAVDGAATET